MEKIEELAKEMARVALEHGLTVEITVKPIVNSFATMFSGIRPANRGSIAGEFKFPE